MISLSLFFLTHVSYVTCVVITFIYIYTFYTLYMVIPFCIIKQQSTLVLSAKRSTNLLYILLYLVYVFIRA